MHLIEKGKAKFSEAEYRWDGGNESFVYGGDSY